MEEEKSNWMQMKANVIVREIVPVFIKYNKMLYTSSILYSSDQTSDWKKLFFSRFMWEIFCTLVHLQQKNVSGVKIQYKFWHGQQQIK